MKRASNRRSKHAGFTLLEALVALLVLSIGLLGLAGLQLHALQYTHSSYQRTLANLQAQDLAERMWTHLRQPRTELTDWQAAHQASLPEWQGSLVDAPDELDKSSKPGKPGTYILTIRWRDTRFAGEADCCALSYHMRIPVLE